MEQPATSWRARPASRRWRGWAAALVVAAWAGTAASAHPGQHMGLKITITETEVRYDILLSADMRKTIVADQDRDLYYYAPEKVYRFVDDQAAERIRRAYLEFFKRKCAVYIDGVRVLPVLEKLRFVPYIVPGIQENPLASPPDVEVVLSYPTKGRPRQVRMVWELYPQDPTRAVYGLPTTSTAVGRP